MPVNHESQVQRLGRTEAVSTFSFSDHDGCWGLKKFHDLAVPFRRWCCWSASTSTFFFVRCWCLFVKDRSANGLQGVVLHTRPWVRTWTDPCATGETRGSPAETEDRGSLFPLSGETLGVEWLVARATLRPVTEKRTAAPHPGPHTTAWDHCVLGVVPRPETNRVRRLPLAEAATPTDLAAGFGGSVCRAAGVIRPPWCSCCCPTRR